MPQIFTLIVLLMEHFGCTVICQKDADGIANSEDPDQIAPEEQSDLGLHCLFRPICPKTSKFEGVSDSCF